VAEIFLHLEIETDLLDDAIAELVRIHQALAYRHGDAFRALDRRIEEIAEGGLPEAPMLESLGGGRFVAIPPAALLALIAEAVILGV